jgi:hypothetical protein
MLFIYYVDMSDREHFKSFISADKTIPELTIKAVLGGAFLAIVLGECLPGTLCRYDCFCNYTWGGYGACPSQAI